MVGAKRNHGLSPETDYREIYKNLATYEFAWDFAQALQMALFRTYAVPSIGQLLRKTGAFTSDTQKRYDDTALLLEGPMIEGMDSVKGKAAIRRINGMHNSYDISNDDMLYTLATFVVTPKRWFDDYGWRGLTEDELTAIVHYNSDLGRRMGIKEIPATYAGFERLLDDYEAENFGFDQGAREVAESTIELFTTFYPRPLRPLVRAAVFAMMDQPLLRAFRFEEPPSSMRKLVTLGLKARSQATRLMPARRKPLLARDLKRVRSYPNGFDYSELGTFPQGCPVSHSEGALMARENEASSL